MTDRRHHPKSRPLPDAAPPKHLLDIQTAAWIGTLDAPIGASLPAIYLAAARSLIREAQRIAAVPDGGPRFTSTR